MTKRVHAEVEDRISYSTRLAGASVALLCGLASSMSWGQSTGNISADEWAKIVAAAQKEKTVVVYSALGTDTHARIRADFQNAYPGIGLEMARFSSGPLIAKLEQERVSGADGADIQISTYAPWTESRVSDGQFQALKGPNASAWPPQFLIKGTVPILARDITGIAYNTKLVNFPVTNYQALLRPELKGKVGVLDIAGSANTAAFYDWLEKTEGGGFLQKLAAQQPLIYTSSPQGAQMVAAGEVAIVNFMNPTQVLTMINQGAPLKIVYPKSAFGWNYVGSIVGWTKRPNAAQVFMDYIMSPRGQNVWASSGEVASPLPNIGVLDAKSINPSDTAPYTSDVLNSKKARFDGFFKK